MAESGFRHAAAGATAAAAEYGVPVPNVPGLGAPAVAELAAEIAPDWDLPTEAVQSGLNTLRSHLELVQGDAALLYEMT